MENYAYLDQPARYQPYCNSDDCGDVFVMPNGTVHRQKRRMEFVGYEHRYFLFFPLRQDNVFKCPECGKEKRIWWRDGRFWS